jgi:hypothetical protein
VDFNQYYYEYFCESLFPPAPELLDDYRRTIEKGFEIAQRSKVLICGTVRNAEEAFPKNAIRVNRLGKLFQDYSVFLYENDSTDKTPQLIQEWAKNGKISSVSERLGSPEHKKDHSYERCVAMAACRNKVLKYIRAVYGLYDYIIMYDFDIAGGFSYDGILHSLGCGKDVMTSNGIFIQDKQILFFDTWAYIPLSGKVLDPVEANLRNFPRGTELVEINSGFGGMAIYKSEIFSNKLEYEAVNGECDHVSLNRNIKKLGFSIYLNPSMMTLYNNQAR